MAQDFHDDGFHEIQLSGKQLVFLFMATTVVSLVIFLFGILVGRGVPRARLAAAEDTIAEASTPLDGDVAMAPKSDQPTPVTGLSYPEQLAGKGTVDPVKPGAAADIGTVGAPAASEPAPAPAAAAPAPKAATPPPAPAPRAPEPKAAAASTPAAAPAATESEGFTVQVTALKNRKDAEAIARRLQSRGYKAYVLAPSGGGQVVYKVRVGMNMQRQEAEAIMRRLQGEEKFKPWITR